MFSAVILIISYFQFYSVADGRAQDLDGVPRVLSHERVDVWQEEYSKIPVAQQDGH
jgi:hypothetical protein